MLTCSCTPSICSWSSSTRADDPHDEWSVFFRLGGRVANLAVSPFAVRAVRGSS